ncbi:MAG TPA: hypothetical protein VFA35_02045, partial [Burkholderiaceae bacterium]|nr:hypothetical protein [Burkholderiaceae bacterium]
MRRETQCVTEPRQPERAADDRRDAIAQLDPGRQVDRQGIAVRSGRFGGGRGFGLDAQRPRRREGHKQSSIGQWRRQDRTGVEDPASDAQGGEALCAGGQPISAYPDRSGGKVPAQRVGGIGRAGRRQQQDRFADLEEGCLQVRHDHDETHILEER